MMSRNDDGHFLRLFLVRPCAKEYQWLRSGGTHKESLFFKYCCLVSWNSVSSQNPGILSHITRFPRSSLKITTLSYLGSLQYLIREMER